MSTSTERVTVTLPAKLVERIDRLETNRNRFVAEAVRNELARRRQAELQRSLARPHQEAAQHAELGLGAWNAARPDGDAGLVDTAAGIAIHWDDDVGWCEDPD